MKYLTRINGMGGDDYRVHQELKSLFGQSKFLFQRTRYETLVLSEGRPRPTQDYLVDTKDVTGKLDQIGTDTETMFSIRVNPVVTKFIHGKNRRLPMEDYRLKEWIGEKLKAAGMDARFVYRTEGSRVSVKKGKTITLSSVLISGIARIDSPQKFWQAFESGIGHAKGLGFGMINVFSS